MGSNHKSAATMIAAAPNHRLANVGTNISTISNIKPKTSQCQGSIIKKTSILVTIPVFVILAFNVAYFSVRTLLKNIYMCSVRHGLHYEKWLISNTKKTTAEAIVFLRYSLVRQLEFQLRANCHQVCITTKHVVFSFYTEVWVH